jgi:hypothetical protein
MVGPYVPLTRTLLFMYQIAVRRGARMEQHVIGFAIPIEVRCA